ncbi:MAG: ribonuclease HI [Chitinophagaceae bacterium]|nr:MAG: ribonuclease HI [Chitinophagaceae bacterium]
MSSTITVYTDGSARGNPGPGGYGTILMAGPHRKELSQGYKLTTNNRMELMAVIAALEAMKKDGMQLNIFSDSQYVVRAIKEGWLKKWIATGFAGGKKNSDLWTKYHLLAQKHKITMNWVKGHADNPFNNRCDELATQAADSSELLPDEGYERSLGK